MFIPPIHTHTHTHSHFICVKVFCEVIASGWRGWLNHSSLTDFSVCAGGTLLLLIIYQQIFTTEQLYALSCCAVGINWMSIVCNKEGVKQWKRKTEVEKIQLFTSTLQFSIHICPWGESSGEKMGNVSLMVPLKYLQTDKENRLTFTFGTCTSSTGYIVEMSRAVIHQADGWTSANRRLGVPPHWLFSLANHRKKEKVRREVTKASKRQSQEGTHRRLVSFFIFSSEQSNMRIFWMKKWNWYNGENDKQTWHCLRFVTTVLGLQLSLIEWHIQNTAPFWYREVFLLIQAQNVHASWGVSWSLCFVFKSQFLPRKRLHEAT